MSTNQATKTNEVAAPVVDVTFTKNLLTKHNDKVSPVIRELAVALNHDHNNNNKTGQIKKLITEARGKDILYQHVRNVLVTNLTNKK